MDGDEVRYFLDHGLISLGLMTDERRKVVDQCVMKAWIAKFQGQVASLGGLSLDELHSAVFTRLPHEPNAIVVAVTQKLYDQWKPRRASQSSRTRHGWLGAALSRDSSEPRASRSSRARRGWLGAALNRGPSHTAEGSSSAPSAPPLPNEGESGGF